MKIHTKLLACVILSALLLAGLSGCAGKPKELTAAQTSMRDTLAQEFMLELRDNILPQKDNKTYLSSLGVMISEDEKVKDMAPFDSFIDSVRAGEDCSLTVAFIGKGFIVTRYQMRSGTGYCFRYEYDEKAESISVTPKVFDKVGVETDESLGKVQMKLEYDGQDIAAFIFRPQSNAGESSEG